VSTIVTKGVDKLGQRRVEQLMVKALRQFSSAIKPSLDKDKPLLRDAFSFLEHRAVHIARKIRELTQSNPDALPENPDLKKYLEENHPTKVPFNQNIERWPDITSQTLRGLDGEALNKPNEVDENEEPDEANEVDEDEELGESNEVKTFHEPDKSHELISPGGKLLQQISEFLASEEVSSHFVCAVKDKFLKVQPSTLGSC
jgi:hypothetical protein